MNVRMYFKDDKSKEVLVSNQIQHDAFLNKGFVDAPDSEQPQPENGEPAVLPLDSNQAEEFDEAKAEAPAPKSKSTAHKTSDSNKRKGAK